MLFQRRVAALGGLVGVGSSYAVSQDEGSRRGATFYVRIAPIWAQYRFIQFLNRDLQWLSSEKANEEYDKLHEKYSDTVKDITFSLRGFYLKQAQIMSTQDDFVPPAYMRWVKRTQDDIPTEFEGESAKAYCASKMKEELGLDFDEIFSEWDHKPLGVASIGQVHKARLRKTGQVVAVKLLVPNIEKKFRGDIKTIKGFCEFAMPQHVSAFAEIEKQFCTEFDYLEEGKNLELCRLNCLEKWSSMVVIPQAHLSLCSKHVLVMEFLKGENLVKGVKRQYSFLAKLAGKELEDLIEEEKRKMAEGKYVFKTIEQEVQKQKKLEFNLWAADLAVNATRFCWNFSVLRLMYGPCDYQTTSLPLNLGKTLDLLCKVHASQIFRDGAFNGDCHPGNILLLDDGRLGLIDYGQVKRLSLQERISFSKLIVAHSRCDKKEVVRLHFDELGTKTKYRNEDIGYKMSAFYNDRDTDDICEGRNIASFVDYMEKIDPMVQVPEQFIMLSRCSLLLRGLGKAFGVRISMAKMWEQDAKELLKQQGIEY